MSHAEVVLPYTVAMGFEADCDFPVDIVRNFSGHEFRNLNAEDSYRQYRASIKGKTRAQTADLLHFHMARGGTFQSFNHKDHVDFSVTISEGVFTALGNSQFQMWKRYSSGGTDRDRKIIKFDDSDIVVKAGALTLTSGVDFTASETTGIVTMLGSPTVTPTTWSVGLFYTPVRFTGKREVRSLDDSNDHFTWGNLGMIEVLNPND